MLEKLFQRKSAIARHKAAPFAIERERFLAHCIEQGYAKASIQRMAIALLALAHKLKAHPSLKVNPPQLKKIITKTTPTVSYQYTLTRLARQWLSFLGYWPQLTVEPVPFAHSLCC